jgi:hypothetical protein
VHITPSEALRTHHQHLVLKAFVEVQQLVTPWKQHNSQYRNKGYAAVSITPEPTYVRAAGSFLGIYTIMQVLIIRYSRMVCDDEQVRHVGRLRVFGALSRTCAGC